MTEEQAEAARLCFRAAAMHPAVMCRLSTDLGTARSQAGGSAHSPRRRCAEPSQASALANPGRPDFMMAKMRPREYSAAATVSSYRFLGK
jgi:hypothetical protein